jgi:hypothetical protein
LNQQSNRHILDRADHQHVAKTAVAFLNDLFRETEMQFSSDNDDQMKEDEYAEGRRGYTEIHYGPNDNNVNHDLI